MQGKRFLISKFALRDGLISATANGASLFLTVSARVERISIGNLHCDLSIQNGHRTYGTRTHSVGPSVRSSIVMKIFY